jgi:hypothetical protein
MLLFSFLFACSSFSMEEEPVDSAVEVVLLKEDFVEELEGLLVDVRVLWEKRERADRRAAQKKLQDFYERRAIYVFSRLHDDHPMEVLAAEQQLGWVIHRLGRHTSRSFRREAGYLEKLSKKMSACAVLIPEPTVLETETSKEEKVIPLPQDSVSTL